MLLHLIETVSHLTQSLLLHVVCVATSFQLQAYLKMSSFHMGARDLEAGLHVCQAFTH